MGLILLISYFYVNFVNIYELDLTLFLLLPNKGLDYFLGIFNYYFYLWSFYNADYLSGFNYKHKSDYYKLNY